MEGKKNEKEYMKENEKNKKQVCYPPLNISKESIMNLCRYRKRRRMKWVIKQRKHLLRNKRKINKQIKGKNKQNKQNKTKKICTMDTRESL